MHSVRFSPPKSDMTEMEASKLDPGWAPIQTLAAFFFFLLANLARYELTSNGLYYKI